MKIVFFGTSEFAVPSLRKLAESRHEILMVVTQPDRKKGRRMKLRAPLVKLEAGHLNIPIHQREDLSRPDSMRLLKSIGADLFVVVAFGQILKKELLELPRFYSINLHASLLPRYRGAAPMNWAIINGEKTSGVSIMKMDEKMDAGDIILSKESGIAPTDTTLTLSEKFSRLGSELLLEAIDLIERGKASFTKQDERSASYAPKLKKEDGLIRWKEPADKLSRLVRGLIPWPGAFTYWNGRLLKIWKVGLDARDFDLQPGRIARLDAEGIAVKAGSEILVIKELQLEGARKMDAATFLRGHKMKVSDLLG